MLALHANICLGSDTPPGVYPALLLAGASQWVSEALSALCWQALSESVDYWPMAISIHQTVGGKPKLIAAPGVISGRYPPPEACMLYAVDGALGT